MPGSVKLSLAALAAAVLGFVATGALSVHARVPISFQLPLTALLTVFLGWSIARRKRLAWLWGRYVGFFLAFAAILGAVVQRHAATPMAFVLLASIVAPFLVVSFALGRASAYAWFGMICPTCGATATRGDFLMRKLRCPGCGGTF